MKLEPYQQRSLMSEHSKTPPVLFLIFNRPDLTQRVFERIRQARPRQLFIAADGPRVGNLNDEQLCAETRSIVEQVDWPCEIHTLFRDENLGCKRAVSSAIDWFFEQVEAGIILEDDCVALPSFFRFCHELLIHYQSEERVMMIGGSNAQLGKKRNSDSYYFSVFGSVWGWATWRRAWQHNDSDIKTWPEVRETDWVKKFMLTREGTAKITRKFDAIYNDELSSWGYGWLYSIWRQNGVCVVPNCNLVTNIGFDERGTHTKQKSTFANLKAHEITFPLQHPSKIVRNRQADLFIVNHLYLGYPLPADVGWLKYLYARIQKKVPWRVRRRLDPLFNFHAPK